MPCPDEETVLAFLEGRLSPPGVARIDTHLKICATCGDLVSSVAPAVLKTDARIVGELPGDADLRPASHAPTGPLPRGTAIGRYVILGLVGRGGMGEVYAAYDPELNRKIALKLLHQDRATSDATDQSKARLLREAKAIARLSHPNVVVVHDAGNIDGKAEGRMFIAMEFVEGQTLAAWLGNGPRPWREIRGVFLAAGRGLAAAHAAGVVHRDFKPQNVMVTGDGHVRVMDFGLASDAGAGAGDAATGPGAPGFAAGFPASASLTRTGTLVGTPTYMAPEQFLAQPADARSDQFSYCVALYEALYGERPFPSESLNVLADAVTAGRIREPPPSGIRLPAWLRRTVLRGLRTDREERFASMEALLAVLEIDPAARLRLAVAAAAVGLLLLGGGAVAQRMLGQSGAALCRGATAKLAVAWEPGTPGETAAASAPHRSAAQTAFMGSGRAFAADAWQRVAGILDEYGRRWTDAYTEACEATHVRGEQSEEVLDLRMTCLNGSLGNLRALTDVFASADAALVGEAVNAANALPDLSRCSDIAVLRAVIPPPREPAVRERVQELRRRSAEVRALRDAGRVSDALARATPLVADARALRYDPVIAEVLALVGLLRDHGGDSQAAQAAYQEALWAAEASRHDEVGAEVAIQLSGVSVHGLGRAEDGTRWAYLAEAILKRMGPGHERLEAWLANNRSIGLQRSGAFDRAKQEMQRAITLKQKALGKDNPDIAVSLLSLGLTLAQLGDHAGALQTAERAREIFQRGYGPGTHWTLFAENNRGESLNGLGRHAEALALFRRVLAGMEAMVGPNHLWLSHPLTGIGQSLIALGRPGEAVPPLARALELRERLDQIPEERGETRFALARALWGSGGDRGRSRTLASAARDDYAKVAGSGAKVATLDDWLAAHRR